jgi:hypothetical protein
VRHGQRYSDSRGVWRSGSGGTHHLDFQNEEKGSSLTSTFSSVVKRVRASKKQLQIFVYKQDEGDLADIRPLSLERLLGQISYPIKSANLEGTLRVQEGKDARLELHSCGYALVQT